jgi:hypothetical protein
MLYLMGARDRESETVRNIALVLECFQTSPSCFRVELALE